MLEAESCKEIKKVPVIEFEIPKHIFIDPDTKLDGQISLINKVWNFDH